MRLYKLSQILNYSSKLSFFARLYRPNSHQRNAGVLPPLNFAWIIFRSVHKTIQWKRLSD